MSQLRQPLAMRAFTGPLLRRLLAAEARQVLADIAALRSEGL